MAADDVPARQEIRETGKGRCRWDFADLSAIVNIVSCTGLFNHPLADILLGVLASVKTRSTAVTRDHTPPSHNQVNDFRVRPGREL